MHSGVTFCNTLDHADSSHAVHMTSCTRHCLPTAPSHLGPIPCAWNLSLQFISLFGPFSYVYFLSHLCLYVTYLFMFQFPLCPFVSPCPYVSASIPDLFALPSSSRPAYISLVCHVCLLSSYTQLLLSISVCARLESSTSQYSQPPETVRLL